MRMNVGVALLVLGVGVGCGERPVPVEPSATEAARPVAAKGRFTDGQYPTESEVLSAGYTIGRFSGTTPTLMHGMKTWSSGAYLDFSWVNTVNAALNIKLIDGSGTTINSGGDSFNWSAWIPQGGTRALNADVGTANHTCGLTGSARLTGLASLWVIKNGLGVTELWSHNVDKSAPDVSWPACVDENSELVASGCPNQIIYDPSTCSGGSGGGDGGGGGTGGAGSWGECQLWLMTISESRDGGRTWVVVDQYYYTVCP